MIFFINQILFPLLIYILKVFIWINYAYFFYNFKILKYLFFLFMF